MKYAQGIMGLLIGTALGGSVVAATTEPTAGTAGDEHIRAVVRDVIKTEPQTLIDSLNAWQKKQQEEAVTKASAVLSDPAVRDAIFNDTALPAAGAVNGKHVIAEFFDYDCPVCKMQFKAFTDMLAKDKELRIVFHEYPIFGPTSEENSKLGLAVSHLHPEKYWDFHTKMMSGRGHEQNVERTLGFIKELGMDVDKVKTYAHSDEVAQLLAKQHALGEKLSIQGTPTLVIGNEIIPHAVSPDELNAKFNSPK